MQRFSLLKYFSIIYMLWGFVVAMHTLCHNFAGLATARFLLGAIEVCTAPAVIYITGSWLVMAALIKRNCPISLQNKQALTSEYSGIPKLSRSQELQSGTRH